MKPAEAQHIAVKIENIKPGRPLTHDLFHTMSEAFGIDVYEVFIHSIAEGVFYSKMLATNGDTEVEIECTVGDAIAFALVYKCPIWIKEDILESSGINMNDDGSVPDLEEDEETEEETDGSDEDQEVHASIEDLEHLMANAIANEEYEIAAEIRDRIQRMRDAG